MSDADDKLELPEWLDETFVAQVLREADSDEPIQVEGFQVGRACGRGTGFLSQLYRVTADVRRGSGDFERVSLVVKSQIQSGALLEVVQEAAVFAKETLAYTVLLPVAQAVLRSAEGAAWTPLAPRCLHAGARPADLLVLEDLSRAGFAVPGNGRLLDRRHISLALRLLARLHAASLLLADHEAFLGSSFQRHPVFINTVRDHYAIVAEKFFSVIADSLEMHAVYEKFALKYRQMSNNILDLLLEKYESFSPQLKVLVHGDMWKNNIMFKYEHSSPIGVRVIDFQNCFWFSPALDIQHLLSTSARLDVHLHHSDALLAEYHDTLQSTLRGLGLRAQADGYPLERLRWELDRLALHGLCMLSVLTPVILAPEELGAEAEGAMSNDRQGGDYFTGVVNNPKFMSHLKALLPIFHKSGVI